MIDLERIQTLFASQQLELTRQQAQQLDQFAQLLVDWNQRMNLTAITDPEEILIKHFLEQRASLFLFGPASGMPVDRRGHRRRVPRRPALYLAAGPAGHLAGFFKQTAGLPARGVAGLRGARRPGAQPGGRRRPSGGSAGAIRCGHRPRRGQSAGSGGILPSLCQTRRAVLRAQRGRRGRGIGRRPGCHPSFGRPGKPIPHLFPAGWQRPHADLHGKNIANTDKIPPFPGKNGKISFALMSNPARIRWILAFFAIFLGGAAGIFMLCWT